MKEILSSNKGNKINSLWILMSVIIGYFVVNYIATIVLETNKLFYDSLIVKLSHDRVMQILDKQQKLQWFSYAFIPVLLFVKLFLVSVVLSTGEVFYNLKLSFNEAFRIAILAEPIFVIMAIVKFFWLWLFVNNLSIEYLQFFVPLSLINLFNPGEIYPWFIYPIQTLNLFEVAYMYILALNVNKTTKCGMEKAYDFVLSSYGLGLIIWIVLVGFITLNFSS